MVVVVVVVVVVCCCGGGGGGGDKTFVYDACCEAIWFIFRNWIDLTPGCNRDLEFAGQGLHIHPYEFR